MWAVDIQQTFLTTEPSHQPQEAEVGRLVGIQSQPVLYSNYQVNQESPARQYLKNKNLVNTTSVLQADRTAQQVKIACPRASQPHSMAVFGWPRRGGSSSLGRNKILA